ncbi:NAD-dependent epimerase/dehydratase [Corchorus olitorius]|uniref:NAD-dependent epimerase/dehydratase n=1 Tax=Corchorus olitorius TaxID=93759 RepID=A0A1R3FZ47_9ROSI|nr:NAD-dependent epimerase/dehydratase [Corchorus olitorius]
MSEQKEKVVCVTGASGYIASWLVNLLLRHGYTVKATVRDPSDKKKTDHLVALDGAKERLQLFKAELLDEGAFDSVVDGCIGVFHTASPCFYESKDPLAELIDPAVKGTLNVLRSCAKVASIKRVIITSSLGAVLFTGKPVADDDIADETWFSDPDFCQKSKLWYMLSKTLAEKTAWKFAQENGIDMAVINPGMAIGPLLHPTLNSSVTHILNLIGAETFRNTTYRFVDVRDVANAHILAFENPSASGRYCVTGKPLHLSQISDILHQLYPSLKLPQKCVDDEQSMPALPPFRVSQERVISLGLTFTPLEVSLKDTVESFKEKNFFY